MNNLISITLERKEKKKKTDKSESRQSDAYSKPHKARKLKIRVPRSQQSQNDKKF